MLIDYGRSMVSRGRDPPPLAVVKLFFFAGDLDFLQVLEITGGFYQEIQRSTSESIDYLFGPRQGPKTAYLSYAWVSTEEISNF